MNKEKFLAMITQHRKMIYKICHSYCPDPEKRNDLQQEILLQLWNSFGKYDGRSKISTWMYRISLNTAISFYRKDKKHREKKVEADEWLISLPESESIEQEDPIALLYCFINKLNDFDKALILLYLDDYKQEDIAEVLGITKTNVGTKIGRIKKVLKELANNYQN